MVSELSIDLPMECQVLFISEITKSTMPQAPRSASARYSQACKLNRVPERPGMRGGRIGRVATEPTCQSLGLYKSTMIFLESKDFPQGVNLNL
jgi:hypothetical protein